MISQSSSQTNATPRRGPRPITPHSEYRHRHKQLPAIKMYAERLLTSFTDEEEGVGGREGRGSWKGGVVVEGKKGERENGGVSNIARCQISCWHGEGEKRRKGRKEREKTDGEGGKVKSCCVVGFFSGGGDGGEMKDTARVEGIK
jgi:hypothetical protein